MVEIKEENKHILSSLLKNSYIIKITYQHKSLFDKMTPILCLLNGLISSTIYEKRNNGHVTVIQHFQSTFIILYNVNNSI